MKVTARSRLQTRLQNIAFVLLFLTIVGLLGWLSTRYDYHADWTAGGRNTLSAPSQTLLDRLDGPITITAYASETELLRERIAELVARYQRHKADVTLNFVNPDTAPDQVRKLGINRDGELVIEYQGRSEHLSELSEQSLTNALQRVAHSGARWVVFLEGHGERNPQGRANHDLGDWAAQLQHKGLTVQTVNLAATPQIPDNTSVLVIAGPQVKLLPGEVKLIKGYLDRGGNLLWLADPGPLHALEPVAESLGIEFQPGTIVDPTGQLFGINHPAFTIIADYGHHPITEDFNTITLFPMACAIDLNAPEGWTGASLLDTTPRSWAESSELHGEVRFDKGSDIAGPLTVGVALSRAPDEGTEEGAEAPAGGREQRVVVICDGDFVSNAYLGNGGNLDLGLNVMNWLSHDDTFIAISAKTAPDLSLNLSRTASGVIGLGFLFALPAALLGSGLFIWLRRRKR